MTPDDGAALRRGRSRVWVHRRTALRLLLGAGVGTVAVGLLDWGSRRRC